MYWPGARLPAACLELTNPHKSVQGDVLHDAAGVQWVLAAIK